MAGSSFFESNKIISSADTPKMNRLIDLVLHLRDKSWSWFILLVNLNITFQDDLEHPELPWDWKYLSINPNITFQDVLGHSRENTAFRVEGVRPFTDGGGPRKEWNWNWLSEDGIGLTF